MRRVAFVQAVIIVCSGFACRLAAADETVRIGVAEADITPPNGFPMAGYYHERLATGTRDPLKAKAIVFRGPHDQAALVVCDLTGIAFDLTTEVRRRASEQTGIPAANIVVSATHSHTAPDYGKDLYEYLGGTPGDTKRSPADGKRPTYAAKLVGAVVEAIVKAHAAARPVVVDAGSAVQQTPVSFCRRFVMRDGSVRTWMSLDHPEVVRSAAPIDPEIGLVAVRAADGDKPLGVLSNFALHLDTVGGLEWAADYPFYIEQSLRKSLGGVVSIFGTGCCGDINHSDPTRRERNKTDFIGGSLAASVQAGLGQLRRVERPELRVRSVVVHVPLQDATEEHVVQAVKILTAAKAGEKIEFYDHVTAYKRVMLDQLRHRRPHVATAEHLTWGLSRTWAGVGETLPVEVSVICLGDDVAIVCLPGEVFVDLGLAIKRASPFRTTLIVELSNCVETLYIPTRAAYAGGGYEVTNSALQPGSGEMLVEAAIRLLRDAASSTPERK